MALQTGHRLASRKATACTPHVVRACTTARWARPVVLLSHLTTCSSSSRSHWHVVCSAAAEQAIGASTATVTVAPPSEGLHELNKDTFYPYLETHADTLVVVDFYTDWCGPCKVIYPQLVKLAEERSDIKIVKFNCNKANKELGVKLGIKVAPTFHLYKNSAKVAEMTGAKVESLVALIDKALTDDAEASA